MPLNELKKKKGLGTRILTLMVLEVLAIEIRQEKKDIQIGKEKEKLSVLAMTYLYRKLQCPQKKTF